MTRRETELLRFAESILKMANDATLAAAGSSDTAYARQDAKMNQGTLIVFVTRDPAVASAMEAGVATAFAVNTPSSAKELN